jgi:hypothetical protein
MVAMAASVVMTVLAIVMGQRKDHSRTDRSAMAGAVGRRNGFVTALASGIFPSKQGKADVEMSGSRGRDADDATVPVDNDYMSTAGLDHSTRGEREGRSYAV